MKKTRIGSSFDDFLKDEGLYEETQASAIKRVIAWQIQKAMEDGNISKSEMARRMRTSRSQLDRLLDPAYITVQLDTMIKAATALGKNMQIEFVNKRKKVA